MNKVYCKTDKYGNVTEAIRGDGIIFTPDEGWKDVSHIPNAHEMTEAEAQPKLKLRPKIRMANGTVIAEKVERKPILRMRVRPSVILANGVEQAVCSLRGKYKESVEVQVNGEVTQVEVGEDIVITSDVAQRIGIKVIDPSVVVKPKVLFVQATEVPIVVEPVEVIE